MLTALLVGLGLALGAKGIASAQIGFGADSPVTTRAVSNYGKARAGEPLDLAIAVVLDHREGFHSWPNKDAIVLPPELGDDFPAIDTAVAVLNVTPGLQVGTTIWPEPAAVPVDYFGTGIPTDLISFKGKAVIFIPVRVAPDAAPGPAKIDLQLTYQTCDESQCYAPESPQFSVPIEILPASADESEVVASAQAVDDFATYPGSGVAAEAAICSPVSFNVFGSSFDIDPCGPIGLALLLLTAALGGFLLNLTPCVLPVLPLKIMAMSRAAGEPKRLILLGGMMSLGVIGFWMAIGVAIATLTGFTSISSLFQNSWFSFVVGLFVAVMAVGMLGLFDVRLPQAVYRFNPSQESPQGSFLFGIMTAVLSTPCTAPFMGSAAAWAATQSPLITLTTFGAIGVGMALPYLYLSFRPEMVNRVPRSGPASVVVKQVMGLFMLAVAAFFLGIPVAAALQTPPDPASRAYWWIVAALIVAACAWMGYQAFKLSESTGRRAFFAGIGALIALTSITLASDLASHGPIDWVYYTPERFQQAADANQVVVVDFTAEWCLNCKALEKAVLHKPEVVALLESGAAIPMKIDLTGDNPDGRALLQQLNWLGIPLLAVFGPQTGYDDTPHKFDTYTVETVQSAVRDAGAASTAAR